MFNVELNSCSVLFVFTGLIVVVWL